VATRRSSLHRGNDRGQIIGLSGDPLFVDDAAAVLWEVHDPAFPDSADDR
jgi:hypothetical protein